MDVKEIIEHDVQIIWQTGTHGFEQSKQSVKGYESKVKVFEFIREIDYAYAAADIIISRAGASSISELSIVGKPVIFIPSSNVAEDHQTKNAKAIVDKKGAILLKESELDTKFEITFSELISNESLQKELSQNIKQLAKPNATKDIVVEIIKLVK